MSRVEHLNYRQQAKIDGYQHGASDAAMIEWTEELANDFLTDNELELSPNPPLSGEFAGDLVPEDLRERYGVSGIDDEDAILELDEVCSAYEQAYYEGWNDRAHSNAYYYLEAR